ncbi:MAG: helix-turn-helix domain-containing protein [Chloroflexota bacterium]
MPTQLSTDQITLKDRPSYWNYLVSSVLGQLDTIPQKKGHFSGQITYSHLDSVPIAEVASTQLTVERPEKYIQNPQEDFYKINFQLAGNATLSQAGRTAILQPGNWVIYDNTRPYELRFHNDYRQMLFLVPRSQLLNRMATVDLLLARPFESQSGMGRLLAQFVAGTLQESDEIQTSSQSQMVQMLLDMLTLGLASYQETEVPLPASSRFLQIKQFMATHLHNPEMSADMLAENLFLSKRYIQKLFADQNTTVNKMIWQMRLDRCKQDLEDPRLANRPIQDIARSWGFSNGAHFSRLFKLQFDCTPKAYRQQALDALR